MATAMVQRLLDANPVCEQRWRSARGLQRVGEKYGAERTERRAETEYAARPDVLVPDIGGWRRERMPTLPSGSAFELAPDWVCEVLSPSTASNDRAVKVPIYARERVGHVWLVDPVLQTLEILRLDGPGYRLASVWRGDVVVQCEPFETLPIRLADVWSP
jgi:Uma2 family endonuclease